jgi:CCR4-NOT transcription complex subunit 7/8
MEGGLANPAAEIRQVWASNLEEEFERIRSAKEQYRYVSMDTEFPGEIHTTSSKQYFELSPLERYEGIKANVNALHLIQVGLAFATADSRPSLAFEINLREFDPLVHPHNPKSIALLADSGIDFDRNRAEGVDASRFAILLHESGLLGNSGITWVTFDPASDFGYLVKLVTGQDLPATLSDFLCLVGEFFGNEVYDVKHMIRGLRFLPGKLEDMARSIGVKREAGSSHQAGSDSILAWNGFRKLRDLHFSQTGVRQFVGVLNVLGPIPSGCGINSAAAATGDGSGSSSNKPPVGGN